MLEDAQPQLAPPGAGVPKYQRLAGKYILLPYFCRRWSWEQAVDVLEREGRDLVDLGRGLDEERLTTRVLVPPQIGLEDSSRYWSYAMVLEHLCIMGGIAAEVIVELTHDRTGCTTVSIADLKPRGGKPASAAIHEFLRLLESFRHATMETVGNREASARFEHPWFGPLSARQWICFVPFHQRIHIRQAHRILKR